MLSIQGHTYNIATRSGRQLYEKGCGNFVSNSPLAAAAAAAAFWAGLSAEEAGLAAGAEGVLVALVLAEPVPDEPLDLLDCLVV